MPNEHDSLLQQGYLHRKQQMEHLKNAALADAFYAESTAEDYMTKLDLFDSYTDFNVPFLTKHLTKGHGDTTAYLQTIKKYNEAIKTAFDNEEAEAEKVAELEEGVVNQSQSEQQESPIIQHIKTLEYTKDKSLYLNAVDELMAMGPQGWDVLLQLYMSQRRFEDWRQMHNILESHDQVDKSYPFAEEIAIAMQERMLTDPVLIHHLRVRANTGETSVAPSALSILSMSESQAYVDLPEVHKRVKAELRAIINRTLFSDLGIIAGDAGYTDILVAFAERIDNIIEWVPTLGIESCAVLLHNIHNYAIAFDKSLLLLGQLESFEGAHISSAEYLEDEIKKQTNDILTALLSSFLSAYDTSDDNLYEINKNSDLLISRVAMSIVDDLVLKLFKAEEKIPLVIEGLNEEEYKLFEDEGYVDILKEANGVINGIQKTIPQIFHLAGRKPFLFFEILDSVMDDIYAVMSKLDAVQFALENYQMFDFVWGSWQLIDKNSPEADVHYERMRNMMASAMALLEVYYDDPDTLAQKISELRNSPEFAETVEWFQKFAKEEETTREWAIFFIELILTIASIWVGGIAGRIAGVALRAAAAGGSALTALIANTLVRGGLILAADTLGFVVTEKLLHSLIFGWEAGHWNTFLSDYGRAFVTFLALKGSGRLYKTLVKSESALAMGGQFLTEVLTLQGVNTLFIAWDNAELDDEDKQDYFTWEGLGHTVVFLIGIKLGMLALKKFPPKFINKMEKSVIEKLETRQAELRAEINSMKGANESESIINRLRNEAKDVLKIQRDAYKRGIADEIFPEEEIPAYQGIVRAIEIKIRELEKIGEMWKFKIRPAEMQDVFYFEGKPSKLRSFLEKFALKSSKTRFHKSVSSTGEVLYEWTVDGQTSYFVQLKSPGASKPTPYEVAESRFGKGGWNKLKNNFWSRVREQGFEVDEAMMIDGEINLEIIRLIESGQWKQGEPLPETMNQFLKNRYRQKKEGDIKEAIDQHKTERTQSLKNQKTDIEKKLESDPENTELQNKLKELEKEAEAVSKESIEDVEGLDAMLNELSTKEVEDLMTMLRMNKDFSIAEQLSMLKNQFGSVKDLIMAKLTKDYGEVQYKGGEVQTKIWEAPLLGNNAAKILKNNIALARVINRALSREIGAQRQALKDKFETVDNIETFELFGKLKERKSDIFEPSLKLLELAILGHERGYSVQEVIDYNRCHIELAKMEKALKGELNIESEQEGSDTQKYLQLREEMELIQQTVDTNPTQSRRGLEELQEKFKIAKNIEELSRKLQEWRDTLYTNKTSKSRRKKLDESIRDNSTILFGTAELQLRNSDGSVKESLPSENFISISGRDADILTKENNTFEGKRLLENPPKNINNRFWEVYKPLKNEVDKKDRSNDAEVKVAEYYTDIIADWLNIPKRKFLRDKSGNLNEYTDVSGRIEFEITQEACHSCATLIGQWSKVLPNVKFTPKPAVKKTYETTKKN